MGRQGNRQRGFSVGMILIAVLVVGLIGASGYLIYQHHKSAAKTTADTHSSQTSGQQRNTTNTQPQQTATTYLDIKEWGVKMPLSSSINDAYYTTKGSNVGSDGLPNTAWLGLASLNSSGCNVSNGPSGTAMPIGSIIRVLPTDTDPVTGELYTQQDPNGITIGGYYYAYTPSKNSTCASATTLQTVNSAFTSAIKSTTTATASS